MALIISLGVSIGLIAKSKDLLLFSFDAIKARTTGLSVSLLYYGLLAAMTLTVLAALSATGLILAIGLMIAPGAIAFIGAAVFHHVDGGDWRRDPGHGDWHLRFLFRQRPRPHHYHGLLTDVYSCYFWPKSHASTELNVLFDEIG